MVWHFCTCHKNSPCLAMPKHERVFSLVQTFTHFFVMRYLECIIMGDEQRAWHAFREVVTGFLGNRRADNYKDLVEELLPSHQKLGCSMSVKIHFLSTHLYSFWKTVVLWVMSMVNISIRTLQQWRAETKGNGAHQCLLIIAGSWCVIIQIRCSIGRRRRPDSTRAIRKIRLMIQYR